METKPDPIIDRIRKLKALSGSANEHEAALAAAKMQELLFQHNLILADVETGEDAAGDAYERTRHEVGRDTWRFRLLGVIGGNNFCRVLRVGSTPTSILVGRPHNIEVVVYMYEHLARELARLAEEGWKARKADTVGHPRLSSSRTWKNSFLLGAVAAVARRLAQQRRVDAAASEESMALVRAVDQELEQAVDSMFGKVRTGRWDNAQRDTDALRAGARAGASVSLNAGVRGGANAGGRQLLGERCS